MVVPLNVLLKGREVAYHLADSDAKAYVCFEGTPELPMAAEGWAGFNQAESCEAFFLNTATPGPHTWSVAARDGAGNAASVTRRYTVAAAGVQVRPDAAIRLSGGAWTGNESQVSTRAAGLARLLVASSEYQLV